VLETAFGLTAAQVDQIKANFWKLELPWEVQRYQ
jgi:hypothetical protein